MHATSAEVERHVSEMGPRPIAGERRSAAIWEREFAQLLDLLSPRLAHLVHRYGLTDMREDAEQVCAIGVLRALESYDRGKARFTTHVTWQLRGELQSLRHRMRLDQRQSARSAGIRTVSIDALGAREDDGASPYEMVDEVALCRVEGRASDHMTRRLLISLLDRLDAPEHERAIVAERIFREDKHPSRNRKLREQHRQVARRTFRNCAKLLAA